MPKFYTEQRNKRGISGAIISGFTGLAFEGISSFLHHIHHKRHKGLHKAVKAMSFSMDVQRNKLMHLENILLMCRIYNAETLEKSVAAYEAYLQIHGACSIQNYTINSMIYLHMIKDKYIEIYNKFISQL